MGQAESGNSASLIEGESGESMYVSQVTIHSPFPHRPPPPRPPTGDSCDVDGYGPVDRAGPEGVDPVQVRQEISRVPLYGVC
jgi:hypothetical protein